MRQILKGVCLSGCTFVDYSIVCDTRKNELRKQGLKINTKKTKIMVVGKYKKDNSIMISNEGIEHVSIEMSIWK